MGLERKATEFQYHSHHILSRVSTMLILIMITWVRWSGFFSGKLLPSPTLLKLSFLERTHYLDAIFKQ
jgi:hypothetical protein